MPVILNDVMSEWPAMGGNGMPHHAWNNMDYLCQVAGCRTVPVEVGRRHYV